MVSVNLAALTGDVEKFISENWCRRPHLFRNAFPVNELPLQVKAVSNLLGGRALQPPYLRVVKGGLGVPPEKWTQPTQVGKGFSLYAADPARLLREVREGATLVLDTYEDHDAEMREICHSLQTELRCTVHATVFITPPGENGLALHIDNKDVFVLQVSGAKRWKVYDQLVPVPDDSRVLGDTDPGIPVIETTLNPGDCLYIPKGTPHVASAPEVISVHVSFLSKPKTWAELMRDRVEEIISGGEFQETPNILDKQLDLTGRYLSMADMIAHRLRKLPPAVPLSSERHAQGTDGKRLSDAVHGLAVSAEPNSRIRAAEGVNLEIVSEPKEAIQFTLGKLKVRMPPRCRGIGQRMLTPEGATVAQAESELGTKNARQLINQLVLYGLARIEPNSGQE